MQRSFFFTLLVACILFNSSCNESLLIDDVRVVLTEETKNLNYTPRQAPSSNVDCVVEDAVVMLYKDDANAVATQLLLTESSDVVIPTTYRDEAFRLLNAVYKSNSPARDSVVVQFDIHEYAAAAPKRLYMAADENATWVQNLKNGNPSGNASIDNLITTFQLNVNFESFLGVFVINMPDNLVPSQLAQLFNGIAGVIYTEVEPVMGDGNRITIAPQYGYTDVTYSYGFGDCQAGCIGRWYWTFRVFTDCSVEHLQSHGTPIEQ